jgi:opacity protein-like surface antigen
MQKMQMTHWTTTLILIVSYATTVFSQDNTKTTFRSGTIGLVGGVNSYLNIKANPGFDHKYNFTKTGFRYGIDLSYRFSKRSAITTGLFYYNVAYKVYYAWILQQPNDPFIPSNTDIRINYLDIPIIYNFSIISQGKILVYTATGVIASFLSSQTGSTTYQDNSVRNFENVNSYITSLQLGVGLQYNLNKNFGIKIEPHYRLFLKGFDNIMEQSPKAMNATIGIVGNLDWKCYFKKGAWRPLPTCD